MVKRKAESAFVPSTYVNFISSSQTYGVGSDMPILKK